MNEPMNAAYGSIEAAAAYSSLSRSTIVRLLAADKLPSSRVGRRVLIRFADLDKLLSAPPEEPGVE